MRATVFSARNKAMLTLLVGRAGTGKTHQVIHRICESKEGRQVLIVPEQFSHETERALCQVGGAALCLRAEVLSFTRLAGRALATVGGLAAPVLDAGGRVLLMHSAVRAVSDHLTVYQRPSRRPAFLSGLIATMDECKRYCVTPDKLCGAATRIDGMEGGKLRDLGLIFGAYDALCARTAVDPRDRLARAADRLAECAWVADTTFFLDGFTEFTPQEYLIIRALLRRGAAVTLALTCDSLHTQQEGWGDDVFAPARRTAAILRRMAQETGITVTVEVCTQHCPGKASVLRHLEENLFAPLPREWAGDLSAVALCRADSIWAEAEWAAAKIRELLRAGQYRCRDIALAARDLDAYGEVLETVFRRYEIPLFLSRSDPILEKPILALVTAALDTAAGGFGRSDLLRYLKTGLTNIPLAQCDVLENYMLLWDVKENRFTQKKDWAMHPRGYGCAWEPGDEAAIAEINAIRRAAAEPLRRLVELRVGSAGSMVKALYHFMEDIGLRERLEERADGLRGRGELKLADEYVQLWDILVGALEQCALLLGETPMTLDEFAGLLPLLLSQYDVGAIPISLDRVTALAADHAAHRQTKVLFLLGADDGSIPSAVRAPGLLTDDDRLRLAEVGLELYPGMEEVLTREMTTVYSVCCAPTECLLVSWPAKGADGAARRPSFLIGRLEMLYPALRAQRTGAPPVTAPIPALEHAGAMPSVRAALAAAGGFAVPLARLDQAMAVERGSLSRAAVEQLYGKQVPLSASRMDMYQSCRFSYFMKYGLRARARESAGLGAPEYGTFLHLVLERVVSQRHVGDAFDLEAVVDGAIAAYVADELGGLEDKTPRFRYLFTRLRRTVLMVARNVLDELDAGAFCPIDFELGFGPGRALPPVEFEANGAAVSVSGFVDRVDGWKHDGKLYLRVVDYKTGKKSFDLTDLQAGLGLQLLLYLFTLARCGALRYGMPVVPAGVLYLPARTVIVDGSRSMSEEKLRRETDKQLWRRGLILNDPDVLAAMESPGEGGYRFLPLQTKRSAEKILADAERFDRLARHIDAILYEIGHGITEGSILANPVWSGPEKNACQWCDYGAACQFEDGRGGDRRRWLPPVSTEEFWTRIGKEAQGSCQ